jgi:CheY-like chemotaxis protein
MAPKILVVDDEHDIEMLFKLRFRKELKNKTLDFHFEFSGEAALQFIEKTSPMDILLILSDINMPGMNGLEMVQRIKEHYPDLKIIMVTAYGDDSNYNDAKKRGVDDFITKPVDFEQLKSSMSKYIPVA